MTVGDDYYTAMETIAKAALEKRPGHGQVCPECKAVPCDCEKQIWNYRVFNVRYGADSSSWNWPAGVALSTAVLVYRSYAKNNPEWRYGPNQRINEPPHQFDKPQTEVPQLFVDTSLPPVTCYVPRPSDASPRSIFAALIATDPSISAELELRCEGDAARRTRVLDAMWDKTLPDVRARAHAMAKMIGGAET
jgi:hypothetical protein